MSVHLGMRHDRLLRKQAAQMFERGIWLWFDRQQAWCVCRDCERVAENVPRNREGRASCHGNKHTKYDYETKVAAAKAVVDGGMSKPEAMVRSVLQVRHR